MDPGTPGERYQVVVHVDAQTSKPGWLGERLGVGYAISVLHPLAVGSP